MKKEKYERTELTLIEFRTDTIVTDALAASAIDYEDDETKFMPFFNNRIGL